MMFNLQTPITTKLLLLVFPLIWFEVTFGVRSEPDVIRVEEGSDVILPCSLSSKKSIVFTLFDWKKDDQKEVFRYDSGIKTTSEQFRGRVSHFEDELKSGNASIIIRNTKVADSGVYTCNFTQLQPRQIFHIKLHVVAAATKPYVTSLHETKDWSLLQCEVRGAFPKPKLHWQDSDGKKLPAEEPKESERGGRYDVILQITVTKTDNYHCVATQEEIKHQIYAQTHVPVHEKLVEDKSSHGAGMLVGVWFSGALTVVAAWVLFEVAKWIIKHRKKGAAPKSSVKRLAETKELKLMSCEVPNVTPQSLWQDSNGHVLPDEDHRFSSEK